MTRYIGKNGIQRGGAIRRNIIGIPPNEKKEEKPIAPKKPRNYATAKKIAKNAGIAVVASAALAGLAIGGHSLYRRYELRQLYNNNILVPEFLRPRRFVNMDPLGDDPIEYEAPIGHELDLDDMENVDVGGEDIVFDAEDEPLLELPQISLAPRLEREQPVVAPQSSLSSAPFEGIVDMAPNPSPFLISGLSRLVRNLTKWNRPNLKQLEALLRRQNTYGDVDVRQILGKTTYEKLEQLNEYLNDPEIIMDLQYMKFDDNIIRRVSIAVEQEKQIRDTTKSGLSLETSLPLETVSPSITDDHVLHLLRGLALNHADEEVKQNLLEFSLDQLTAIHKKLSDITFTGKAFGQGIGQIYIYNLLQYVNKEIIIKRS